MEAIGAVSSLRDDAAMTSRVGKNAGARPGDDQEQVKGAFDDALANLVVPTAFQPIVAEAPKLADISISTPSDVHDATAAHTQTNALQNLGQQTEVAPSDALVADAATPNAASNDLVPTLTAAQTNAAQTNLAQSESADLSAQLTALGVDEAAATPATQTTSPKSISNAAVLSASRSNAGANAAQLTQAPTEATDETVNAANPNNAATQTVSNSNAAPQSAQKAKPVELEAVTKSPTQAIEAVSTTTDGAAKTSVISGQEVATPANDQLNRAPQLTPHTIPMLAATMMRRLESGSKQFMMRLDPPELGQVEVKLTVAADKKVRAVISADRPEALADLVRSARDLARALHDAGLDLDDNGLTFQLNDPSSGRDRNDQRDAHSESNGKSISGAATHIADAPQVILPITETPNDPFQRWQRARIALTV